MLDKQDLQAIKELIAASENRTLVRTEELIAASENRTLAHTKELIEASENRTVAYTKELIEASENRTHAYIEGAVIPQLQILAEGQQMLLETLAPKNRVEALEDEVVFIKSVMKAMSQEIAELKKAQ